MWQHESGTAVGRILRHDFEEKLSVARFSRDESLFACWSRFLWRSHSPVPSEAGDGRALLSCLCSGGFIPPSSFCCRGAALLRPVWAGVHALTRRGRHQAVRLRFNDCGLGGLAIHAGASLAGKDSMDASSTMSSAYSSEGGSCASFGAGNLSSGL